LSTPTGAAKAPPGKGINALESYNKVRYLLPCTSCHPVNDLSETPSGGPVLSGGIAKVGISADSAREEGHFFLEKGPFRWTNQPNRRSHKGLRKHEISALET